MSTQIHHTTVTLYKSDGTTQQFPKAILGDAAMVQWVADQYAEVNNCGVIIQEAGKNIAIAGNVQI